MLPSRKGFVGPLLALTCAHPCLWIPPRCPCSTSARSALCC